MTLEVLREIVTRLQGSANALAVLAAAVDARANDAPLDRALEPHVKQVLDALGVPPLGDLDPHELGSVLSEIRGFAHLNLKLLYPAGRVPGWTHTNPELLQAIGGVTHNLAPTLKNVLAPKLEGLAARLDAPGGAFLDVGTGVGKLSLDMARVFPSLRIVGIDPWLPSLKLARENVEQAGVSARVELRELAGENLSDEAAFDLAWIASVFMPERAVPAIAQRVWHALRPGGWLLFAVVRPSADPLMGPLGRFRMVTFGGGQATPDDAEKLLKAAGYVDVRTLPGPPTAVAAIVAARRP